MLRLNDVNVRKFKLSEQFVAPYKDSEVPWGPVGYVTFKRTYARRLAEFEEGCRRYRRMVANMSPCN
jgi:hypothetical protein